MTEPQRARATGHRAALAAAVGCVLAPMIAISQPVAAAQLIMFEEAGCIWCAAWQREIGGIYPRTEEGQQAPLRRIDKADERPADLRAIQAIHFTPTFVLVEDGEEIGRIVGYPGEHFFWPMLQDLLDRLDARAGS